MSYAAIQMIDFGNAGSASSIVSGSYTLTSGSRVVLACCYASGSDKVTTISDTNGNTWSKIGTGSAAGGSGMFFNFIECKNVTNAGSTAITINLSSASTQRGMAGYEFSGLDPSAAAESPVYQYQSNPGTGTDAITTGNLTPVTVPAVLFGFHQDVGNSDTVSTGTGFTGAQASSCSIVNGVSYTIVQHKGVASTSGVPSTATSALGASHSFMSMGVLIPEPSSGVPIAAISHYLRTHR